MKKGDILAITFPDSQIETGREIRVGNDVIVQGEKVKVSKITVDAEAYYVFAANPVVGEVLVSTWNSKYIEGVLYFIK